MNTQQAKFILQAYRPGGQDANDPQFAEALEQVKNDPHLAEWFAAQTAFDGAVAHALGTVAPPPQLREMILAGRRVIEPAPWWRRPIWWAMAASIVALFAVAGLWFRGDNSARFADYRQKMMAAHENGARHVEFENGDSAKMQLWLASQGAETNFALPAGLRGKAAMGCRVVPWHGREVAMICYVLDQTNHFDLFLARSSDFSDAPRSEKPELTGNGRVTTAGWSRDGWTYLVIGEGDDAHLKKFMETKDLVQRSIEGMRSAGVEIAQFPQSPAASPDSRNFFGAFHGIYAKVMSRKVEETFLAQAMGLRFLGISSPDSQPKL
jgi:anti-sigma factor RsiW